MIVALAGTRGIPNNYGGFEQFAQQLSKSLAEKGFEVIVYNPHYHIPETEMPSGIQVINISCPETIFKGAAHFLYDYRCVKDAVNRGVDALVMCGYGTSAPAIRFVKRGKTKFLTNMDGQEWQRGKYNFITRKFLLWMEGISVRNSDAIIADHLLIQDYYRNKYKVKPVFIPYGADICNDNNAEVLKSYDLHVKEYFLCVARNEPENQTGLIIDAWKASGSAKKLVLLTTSKRKIYKANGLVQIHGLYDAKRIHGLRQNAAACVHGHTVGGTNPSLLEAMAAGSPVISHKNSFNTHILKGNALLFNCREELKTIFESWDTLDKSRIREWQEHNIETIRSDYSWEAITDAYISLFRNFAE